MLITSYWICLDIYFVCNFVFKFPPTGKVIWGWGHEMPGMEHWTPGYKASVLDEPYESIHQNNETPPQKISKISLEEFRNLFILNLYNNQILGNFSFIFSKDSTASRLHI